MNKLLTSSLLVMIYLSIADCNPYPVYESYSLESKLHMYPNMDQSQRFHEPTFNSDNHIGHPDRKYVNTLSSQLLNEIILYLIDYSNSMQKYEHHSEQYPHWIRRHAEPMFR